MAVFTGLGSASAPSITFSADTNTGIFSPGADRFAVTVDGTKRLEIDNTGTVIVPSPGKIQANRLENSEANEAIILDPSDDSIQIITNANETARFTSNGVLLIGSPNSISVNNLTAAGLQLSSLQTAFGASISIARFLNDSIAGQLDFAKSRSGTLSPGVIVQNNDSLGTISFCGDDGVDLTTRAASIYCGVDGTPGANDIPGYLEFRTATSGSNTERLRIDSLGNINIGTSGAVVLPASTSTSGLGLTITANGGIVAKTTQAVGSVFLDQNILNYTSGSAVYQRFRIGGTAIGSISSTNGTSVLYNTSSDYRLKENVVNLDNAVSRLNQLSVCRFNFISDPDNTIDGFLAHEVQGVVPEAVTGEKDEMEAIGILTEWNGKVIGTDVSKPDDLTWEAQIEVSPAVEASYDKEGNEITPKVSAVYETVTRTRTWEQTGEQPLYQGIDQSKLVPLLTAALQEAIGRIELLEAEVTALQA